VTPKCLSQSSSLPLPRTSCASFVCLLMLCMEPGLGGQMLSPLFKSLLFLRVISVVSSEQPEMNFPVTLRGQHRLCFLLAAVPLGIVFGRTWQGKK